MSNGAVEEADPPEFISIKVLHNRYHCVIECIRYWKQEDKQMKNGTAGAAGGVIWFTGWLFTIAFAHLVWWKIILGIVVWPLYLGWALG